MAEEEEEALNLDDELSAPPATRKRVAQPTLSHLFRFKKPAAEAEADTEGGAGGEPAAKKRQENWLFVVACLTRAFSSKKKKKKKKKEAVIESEEEEVVVEEGGAKKKRKGREKKDRSHLRGPVDVARGTVLSVMRSALGSGGAVTKDASLVMSECARVFVHFLAARSDECAREHGKTLVMPTAVMEAAKDLELDFVLSVLEEMMAAEADKKAAAAKAKEQKKEAAKQ
jgi:hypothetical protein